MVFEEVYNTFSELKKVLEEKKQAIIKKDLEKIATCDEMSLALCEKIQKYNLDKENDFSQEQKASLKALGGEIKVIQENNEILIKHSLDVINNILTGILNIAQNEKNSYNEKGIGLKNSESLDISSITEEA